jgi:hypothetical protein
VRKHHLNSSEKILIQLMHRYCRTVGTGKIIKDAKNLVEVWLLLETHFDKQTTLVDSLLSLLLKTDQGVNDTQVLSFYDKTLQAIQQAGELGRMQDLLTPNQVEMLLTVLPKKKAKYWRIDQLNVVLVEVPMAFHNFVRRRIQDLRSNISPARPWLTLPSSRPAIFGNQTWRGSCTMGDVWGRNHESEACNMFNKLSPRGRLAVVQRKQTCQFWFRYPDNQPCTSQSQPACLILGCG